MTEAERKLLAWHKTTYVERTRALKSGTGRIDWIDPGTRVSWSEIMAKAEQLGIARNVVDLRIWWDEHR